VRGQCRGVDDEEGIVLDASIRWIRRHAVPGQGIVVSSHQQVVYPEVTGYYIPTLLALGERELARQFADWLVRVQQADGSFAGPDGGTPFAFDTGQVIRGWVALLPQMPTLEQPLRRACEWVLAASDPATGRLPVPLPGGAWSLGPRGEVSEAIHLYCLAPLRAAGDRLGEPRYAQFVDRSRDYYLRAVDCTRFDRPNLLTHFYAYIQEALLELGCGDEVRRGMADVAQYQQSNGAVPAYHDVAWVCATGIAQLAQVWYRLGESTRANAALGFLETLQNPSGGFWGSYGVGATYFPAEEPSWGVKYYVEAAQCRIADHFDRTTPEYRPEISEHDGRAQAVLQRLGSLSGKRVLDAGAGKGRYAAMLQRRWPEAAVTALDVSAEMLRHVPAGITTVQHSLLDLPFGDGQFDAVICIEALEHAVQIDEAVGELVRVLAPGGVLVIIDKNKRHLGALDMPSWERWFEAEELTTRLAQLGLTADAEFIAYDERREPDGLFICWTGRKPRPADAAFPILATAAVG
jgi:malonyl-CoA O-methyltransferase